jgi:hypothetical protein
VSTDVSRMAWASRTSLMTAGLLSTHSEVSQDEYDLYRMIYGLPESPEEIVPGSALPLESCMDVHGGGM